MGKSKASPRARLEAWMANPGCHKNVASAVFGISMTDLAGADQTPKVVSPFASALGNQFEFSLTQSITSLLSASDQSGLNGEATWPEIARTIKNPDNDDNRNSEIQLARSIEELRTIIDSFEHGLINQVVNGFRIPFAAFDSTLEIDMLAISPFPGDPKIVNLVIGEVKVYPDLGGYIDERKVSGARRQAGLYFRILTDWISSPEMKSKFPDVQLRVHDRGFIVLTYPHSSVDVSDSRAWSEFVPSLVTNENLETQSEIISTNFQELLEVIEKEKSTEPLIDEKFDVKSYIDGLDHKFVEGCWGRCPLAQYCYDKAVESGDLVVLGSRLKGALGNISVTEAIRLANESHVPNTKTDSGGSDFVNQLILDFADFRFSELEDI